jgi:hypothetical protein
MHNARVRRLGARNHPAFFLVVILAINGDSIGIEVLRVGRTPHGVVALAESSSQRTFQSVPKQAVHDKCQEQKREDRGKNTDCVHIARRAIRVVSAAGYKNGQHTPQRLPAV